MNAAGVFYAFATVRPDASIDRVERLMMDEIERVRREPVSASELAKAKRQLEVDFVDGQATTHALAARIGRDVATFGRVRPLAERLAEIQAVTAEDVQRVARTWLRADRRNVVQVVSLPEDGAGPPEAGR